MTYRIGTMAAPAARARCGGVGAAMPRRLAALLVAGALAGCGSGGTGASVSPTAAAGNPEQACIDAVNVNSGSRGASVVASEPTSAGSRVTLSGGSGRTWTCTATSSGVVASLSVA